MLELVLPTTLFTNLYFDCDIIFRLIVKYGVHETSKQKYLVGIEIRTLISGLFVK